MNDEKQEVNLDESNGKRLVSEKLDAGYSEYVMGRRHQQTSRFYKLWDAGEKGLTLSAFEWEKERKTLIYGQVDYMYREALYKPEVAEASLARLFKGFIVALWNKAINRERRVESDGK